MIHQRQKPSVTWSDMHATSSRSSGGPSTTNISFTAVWEFTAPRLQGVLEGREEGVRKGGWKGRKNGCRQTWEELVTTQDLESATSKFADVDFIFFLLVSLVGSEPGVVEEFYLC